MITYMKISCDKSGIEPDMIVASPSFSEGECQEYPHMWVEFHPIPLLQNEQYICFYLWREIGNGIWEIALDPTADSTNAGSRLLELMLQSSQVQMSDLEAGQRYQDKMQEILGLEATAKAPPWERERLNFAKKMEALMAAG